MSKYHKFTELSIAFVSLLSLVFNFLFPHIALANKIIVGEKNTLNFAYTEATSVLPYSLKESHTVLATLAEDEIKKKDNGKLHKLPIEQPIIIAVTSAKMVIGDDVSENISEDENNRIAEDICLKAGITDLPCWQDLKAMREKESYNGKAMTGDGGKSRGWYHIQTKMHKITDACAMDFKCSTEWTVKYLIANGYTTNRVYAISRHNGSGIMAQNYARSVVYNSAKYK